MNVERYTAESLRKLLRKRRIATMPELKKALGTDISMTVFRKLRELGYRTSYSHGSQYYTLDDIAKFDDHGLWVYRDVRFSQEGTLLSALVHFVQKSEAGLTNAELRDLLGVSVKESLLRLVRKGGIAREHQDGRFVYYSADTTKKRKQMRFRRSTEDRVEATSAHTRPLTEEAKAAILLFVTLLDEKQRRLFAGVESLRLGPGNDKALAKFLGVHPQTITAGRRELQSRDLEIERTRKKGGGRKPLEKKRRS